MNNIDFLHFPSIEHLDLFFKKNIENQKTFRYFKSRGYEVIENHKKRILAYNDEKYLGYGHLDVENNKIWLGIMVCDDCKGLGIGGKIMTELLTDVYEDIYLTVDKTNSTAINLYKKHHFIIIDDSNNFHFLMKKQKNL